MAYRPSWTGHLKVSLVSCPVVRYNATTHARMVSFHLLNPETMNRIQMRPYDPGTGEVGRQSLVHGYEMVDIAARIIEQASGAFRPDEFEDRYETALHELIEARARGKDVAVAEAPRDTRVVDLMAALKASLGRRRLAPSGGGTVLQLPKRNSKQRSRCLSKPRRARG